MPEFDPETRDLISAMLLLAVLLVVVALGIQVIAVYRRRMKVGEGPSNAELAESFREAFEAGEMSAEEYRQVREALGREPASPPPGIVPDPPADPSPTPLGAAEVDATGGGGGPASPEATGDETPS